MHARARPRFSCPLTWYIPIESVLVSDDVLVARGGSRSGEVHVGGGPPLAQEWMGGGGGSRGQTEERYAHPSSWKPRDRRRRRPRAGVVLSLGRTARALVAARGSSHGHCVYGAAARTSKEFICEQWASRIVMFTDMAQPAASSHGGSSCVISVTPAFVLRVAGAGELPRVKGLGEAPIHLQGGAGLLDSCWQVY